DRAAFKEGFYKEGGFSEKCRSYIHSRETVDGRVTPEMQKKAFNWLSRTLSLDVDFGSLSLEERASILQQYPQCSTGKFGDRYTRVATGRTGIPGFCFLSEVYVDSLDLDHDHGHFGFRGLVAPPVNRGFSVACIKHWDHVEKFFYTQLLVPEKFPLAHAVE